MSGFVKFLIRAVVGAGLAVLMSRFFFSSSFLIHGPDSDFFGRHGVCIGVGAQEGPVSAERRAQSAEREAQGIKIRGEKDQTGDRRRNKRTHQWKTITPKRSVFNALRLAPGAPRPLLIP